MAIFNFFRNISYFVGRDTSGLQTEDVDFVKWVNAHRNWRQRLIAYIDGSSQEALDEKLVCQDHLCDLGKWIHSNGNRYYGDLDVFKDLRRKHAVFHLNAGDVVHTFKAEGKDAARKLLRAEFDHTSIQVVAGLQALERKVKS